MQVLFRELYLQYRGKSEYVLCDDCGDFVKPRRISRVFNLIQKGAGVKHIKLHGLRHTFVTRLIENETDIEIISSYLGHSSSATTTAIYAHVPDECKKAEVSKLKLVSGRYYKGNPFRKVA